MAALDLVLDALLVTFRALPALAGVTVYDGSPVSMEEAFEIVLVGDDGDPTSEAASTYEREWVDLACTRAVESGEVPCAVVIQSGDTNPDVLRSRSRVLAGACEDAIVADQTLGGVVMSASVARGQVRPLQNEDGAAVLVPFTVRYKVHI